MALFAAPGLWRLVIIDEAMNSDFYEQIQENVPESICELKFNKKCIMSKATHKLLYQTIFKAEEILFFRNGPVKVLTLNQ